ncbi:hypothetical protein DOM21_07185 [Bacteriovorax stolpii]|uniref:hypothetical protein n=1 Tax=Bacteriovorax stolpii TaxID=960 RepID=UPI0011581C0B|nr:hypothetical protein [Bacteriovorax stolpii]QDK41243.1 hypothetical protein DOM21_07185 [Bacteriovorax stolpii]
MGLFEFQCASTFILGVMKWLLILGGNEDSFLWKPVDTGFGWAALSWLITAGYVYRGEKNDYYEEAYRQEKKTSEERSQSEANERWHLRSQIRVMKEERETFLNLTEKLRATLEMKMQEPKVITVAQEVFKQEQDAISSFI